MVTAGARFLDSHSGTGVTETARQEEAIDSIAVFGGTLTSACLASAAFRLPAAWTRSFVNSAFCKRCTSKLETEIVAITMAHGMTGEIQKNGAAKLISAIQARLAKVPNKNATRRTPYLNGKGYRHKACTINANGKATPKSTK